MNKLLIANWKMQLSHNDACTWIEKEIPSIYNALKQTGHELVICPAYTELAYATSLYPDLSWGAQDCSSVIKGAYTGDVSAQSLFDVGVRYTIVGHSERRLHHGETDEQIAQKVQLLLSLGIHPIVCVGERADQMAERDKVLEEQLRLIIPLYNSSSCIIAYEPIWAIGTGKTPTSEHLEETCAFIRSLLVNKKLLLLYGGSIQAAQAQLFSHLVDGFLLGGASLSSEELKKIILIC